MLFKAANYLWDLEELSQMFFWWNFLKTLQVATNVLHSSDFKKISCRLHLQKKMAEDLILNKSTFCTK